MCCLGGASNGQVWSSPCSAGGYFDREGSYVCATLSWVLVREARSISAVVRLRAVGIYLVNCIPVLHNHDCQAEGFCFVPRCSFRAGVLGVCCVYIGIFKNPLSR